MNQDNAPVNKETPEQELARLTTEYKEFESLFQHPGWKKFVDSKKVSFDNVNSDWFEKFSDDKDLHVARGYLKALKNEVIHFQQTLETVFAMRKEQLENPSHEASEDVL